MATPQSRPKPKASAQMTSAGVRLLRLFVTSYAPLLIILGIRHYEAVWPLGEAWLFWAFMALGTFGLVDAYRLPRGALRKGRTRQELSNIVDEGWQVAAYFVTYLLPFLGIQLEGWRDALSLLIFFGVLFLVFVRSDLALVNPTLYLTGWRVVSATIEGKRALILVPKNAALTEGCVNVVSFGNFLVYDSEARD